MRIATSLLSFILLWTAAAGSAADDASRPVDRENRPPPTTAETKTSITSDSLEVINTEKGNRFIFSGSVAIQGEDFLATCDRMEVKTDSTGADDFGAIALIEATGEVTIRQGSRVATAGKALIYPQEDEVVLEDGPKVADGRGTVTGYRMILHGKDRKITVEPGPDGVQPRVELPSLRSIRNEEDNE